MIRFPDVRAIALSLTLIVGAHACGRKADTTTTANPTNTQTPVSVVAVDLGRGVDAGKQVTDKTEVFKPNDTIYASIKTSGTSPSSRIGVKWTYQDGQVVAEGEQVIAPSGPEATEFHINKPDGFPAGNYKVEVFVDGASVESKDFKVEAM